ncbi:MFS transporter [Actinoplanes sp. M2I2]|uniref:MFS transporter n=1 Tax=Actinoplanes sp. M2I2 TaxID=1734444 RepID=UPI002020642E|nr:MFS transporter [Actinoplanes sp. M2I2]
MAEPRSGLGLALWSFVVNGALYGSLLSRFAEIADRVGAGEIAFGAALGAGAVGGLAGSVLTPWIARLLGTGGAVTAAGCAYAVLATAAAWAPNLLLLATALVVLGVVDGCHDVSMNTLAAQVQQRSGTSVMGRVHAAWSLALSAGAALGAGAAALPMSVPAHVSIVALAALLIQLGSWWRTRRLLITPEAGPEPRPPGTPAGRLRRARSVLIMLAAAAVAASYVESPGQEWSALLLSRGFEATAGLAAAGPLAFSAGLLVTRLLLDPLTRRLSVMVISTTAAATITVSMLGGLLVAAADGPAWLALGTLAVAGAGAGPIFPLLFGAAGTLTTRHGVTAAVTASIISTCSRTGGITAPVLVGALTSVTGLATVLAVMAAGGATLLLTLPRAVRRAGG